MKHNDNNSLNEKKIPQKVPSPFTLRHMMANKMNMCSSGKFNTMELDTNTHTHEHSGSGPNSDTLWCSSVSQFIRYSVSFIHKFYSLYGNVLLVAWSALHINHFHMKINCHYILLQSSVHYIRSSVNRSWILYSMFHCQRRSPSTEYYSQRFTLLFVPPEQKPINIFRMSNFLNINHFQMVRTHIHPNSWTSMIVRHRTERRAKRIKSTQTLTHDHIDSHNIRWAYGWMPKSFQ